ncbi:tetrapyrrole biosynthesis [Dacryopinax primogenitus]|uniref:Tetrapyrrole biosynthesis n=1 Tax=Dacryopinax primogenitus (strain DJM 731) TaxID=1858805 RepID=M5G2X7_DACPD|nr:tetrapyrrole biosynthesis [Dacryopinax primogenitus]EJU00182.1 tetrapyrrole biosynthesis [Dacryopinax primogenitus]
MSITRKAVIILKSPSTGDLTLDPYYKALSEHEYAVHFIPVLEDAFCNEDALDNTLLAGPSTFSGVIITSGRAVKAWESSARRLSGNRPESISPGQLSGSADYLRFLRFFGPAGWDRIPFYAVGRNTAEQMRSMTQVLGLPPCLCPGHIIGDESTGTGEKLAHFIVRDMAKRGDSQNPHRSLLFLTGDKVSNKEDLAWVAFFSPSGARTALPSLRCRFQLKTLDTESTDCTLRLAVIGPTTAAFLKDKYQLVVDAMALKPDPHALAQAMSCCDHLSSS